MATNYKNIVITPNRDTAANVVPVIRFSGGDATTNTDIYLRTYTTSNGTLSFEGSAGQLFSITNDLSGTIFSVNDISGIPSLEIDATGLVAIAEYGGNVAIGRSNANYKLDVVGVANVSNLLVNGNMVFTAANDGAGSNLDADLLDGKQGTYYGIATDVTAANRVANAAFLHANAANITADLAFNKANAANVLAFNALPNTSGVSFNGNLTIPGELTLGTNLNFDTSFSTKIVDPAANTLAFHTTQTERMRIDSSGNIGIGTNAPIYSLEVRTAAGTSSQLGIRTGNSSASSVLSLGQIGAIGWDVGITATTGHFQIGINGGGLGYNINRYGTGISFHSWFTDGSERMRVDPKGNVLIGRTDSTVGNQVKLDVNGKVNAAGILINGSALSSGATLVSDSANATRFMVFSSSNTGSMTQANVSTALTYNPSTGTLSSTLFNSTSDINKKENIVQVTDALNILYQIDGVRFTWKDNGLPSLGVIAQQVEKVLPEIVESEKSVNYNGLIAVLIEAVKELKAEIEELKKNR